MLHSGQILPHLQNELNKLSHFQETAHCVHLSQQNCIHQRCKAPLGTLCKHGHACDRVHTCAFKQGMHVIVFLGGRLVDSGSAAGIRVSLTPSLS